MAASSFRVARRRVQNAIFVGFCYAVTAVALIALAAILFTLLKNGAAGINLDLFTKAVPPEGEKGGLADGIIGSILMCGEGMAIALIIGILAGTWLAEYGGTSRYGIVVRFLNDVLLSAPSILIGLFVAQIMITAFIHHPSGYAGGVALALLAIPVITRTTEDVLLLQPVSLRESGVALGTPFWTVIRTIIWRASSSGILTGALLAFARISGETAPLLFTALGNNFISFDMYHAMSALPLSIFQLTTGSADQVQLAWTGALLVSAAVLVVTIVARLLSQEQKRG
ncbi:MAG TPA: phosphate ABC transporter permease PstA [Caulobacteraceae bacterium]|jgi:phosphate transport system permease protein